jgi:hypothetical protein
MSMNSAVRQSSRYIGEKATKVIRNNSLGEWSSKKSNCIR